MPVPLCQTALLLSIWLSASVNHKCESQSGDYLDHSYRELGLGLWPQTQRQDPSCYRLNETSRHKGFLFPSPAKMLYQTPRGTERRPDVRFRQCPMATIAS